MYFNFNHGLKDVSGNNIVVGSQNIDIHNGHAGFNGKSKITIWRFNDAPIGQHFSIQMRFKPNPDAHKLNIKKEHLISNCGWRVTPSIDVFISPYESSIHFVVQTTHSKLILNGKYNVSCYYFFWALFLIGTMKILQCVFPTYKHKMSLFFLLFFLYNYLIYYKFVIQMKTFFFFKKFTKDILYLKRGSYCLFLGGDCSVLITFCIILDTRKMFMA